MLGKYVDFLLCYHLNNVLLTNRQKITCQFNLISFNLLNFLPLQLVLALFFVSSCVMLLWFVCYFSWNSCCWYCFELSLSYTKTSPPSSRVAAMSVMQHKTSLKHLKNLLETPLKHSLNFPETTLYLP